MSPVAWSTSSSAERPAGRLRLAALLALCLTLLCACSGGSKPAVTPTATISTDSPGADKPTPQPSAAATSTAPAGSPTVGEEPVAFMTSDGVTVQGHFYAAAGPKRKVVIFATAAPAVESAWQPFARELAAGGVAAFTVQLPLYMPANAAARDPALMPQDLATAVAFVQSRDYPLVYVVGDLTEGTSALKLAASAPDVAGVVTVSAPLSFGSLDVSADVANVHVAKLFVASQGDVAVAQALSQLQQAAADPKQSQLYDGSAHGGSELLQGSNAAAFKQLISDFVGR